MLDLRILDQGIFRLPYHQPSSLFETLPMPPNATRLMPNHEVRMQPLGKVELLANHARDEPIDLALNPDTVNSKSVEVQTACKIAVTATRLESPARPQNPGNDITVTTLGTGSAIPSKYRNVSSTLLSIPNLRAGQQGAMLLDCGEGTLGQMRRCYGPDGMRSLYDELKMIFISHMHADHHLGLHSILEDRFKVSRPTAALM
jgi:ribonuclease Z